MTRDEDGFTLVEVLIALALLGMLTTLAYGAVRFGTLMWEHTTERRDTDAERDAVIRVLRQSVGGAYPSFVSTDYADRRITFDGTTSHLALVAPLSDAIAPGVMGRISFDVLHEGARRGLFMAWALDLPASEGGALPLHTVQLAADVAVIRLSYFGSKQPGQPPDWWDSWTDMTSLPDLVRVQAWRRGATTRPWLDLSIETATTTNTDCVYLAEEPACRRLE